MCKSLFIAILLLGVGSLFALGQKQSKPTSMAGAVPRNIHKVEELTAPQLDAFSREKTLFILPVGTLEEHGPHLPIGTDSLLVMFRVSRVSEQASLALPDWNIVLMPPVNYGEGGANEIGGIHVHPGTYGIRQTTLRSIIADVGGQIAHNRFKWIFVVHGHGGRNHNVAISEACDFVSETYSVTMLNLTSILWADAEAQAKADKISGRYYSPAEINSFGLDLHAGVGETSDMLAVRPDLVSPAYKNLPSQSGKNMAELRQIASARGWPGYFSSPARASAVYGKDKSDLMIGVLTDYILRTVRSENMSGRPRFPTHLPKDPATVESNRASLDYETSFGEKLERWLTQRKKQ